MGDSLGVCLHCGNTGPLGDQCRVCLYTEEHGPFQPGEGICRTCWKTGPVDTKCKHCNPEGHEDTKSTEKGESLNCPKCGWALQLMADPLEVPASGVLTDAWWECTNRSCAWGPSASDDRRRVAKLEGEKEVT